MKVSIIMATYNRNALLKQTLQGMVDMDVTGLDWEVLVVDNAGNDDTARISELFSSSIPLKFLVEKAPGKNNALNAALGHADGDLIIFTDDDVIPDKAWVISLIAAASRWAEADLFGGCILPKFPQGMTVPSIDDSVFMRIAYVISKEDIEEGEIPAGKIWGPNMMVRRRVFDQGLRFNTNIGPKGSNYVMGSETEFLRRANDAGHTAVYVPSALVYHQIRPEQLTHSWLYGRAYRWGRTLAFNDQSETTLKNKKWMLREIAILCSHYMASYALGTESERLGHGIRFHKMRGYVCQWYKSLR
jgi:glycosyltransferase involved in cell wall biosynthesis